MNAKNTAIIVFASMSVLAVLGCVQPGPQGLECIPEGGTIPVIASPPECCSGLTLIPPKEENILGIMGYCTAKCGNGTCDQGTESSYNCPSDCTTEQATGPEAYSGEQDAFNALEDELNDLEEPTADDLEELLGG